MISARRLLEVVQRKRHSLTLCVTPCAITLACGHESVVRLNCFHTGGGRLSYRVAVIGAAGHVGLPLALVLAEHGNETVGIDIDEVAVDRINGGSMPFYEEGSEALLEKCLASGNFRMTTDLSQMTESEVLIIVLGTPVDENFNPVLAGLMRLVDELCPLLREGQQIILRSTVSPGTTDRIKEAIEKKTGMAEGEDFGLIYAPERVLQGKAISEIRHLPHII